MPLGPRSGTERGRARAYLSRLLWSAPEIPADLLRETRRLTIESYLSERRAKDAYIAMLRFQQDYRPVSRAEAELFANGLLTGGMEKKAVTWLPSLGGKGPLPIIIQLKAGLVAPADALAAARNAALTERDPSYWPAVLMAARTAENAALEVEAMELMLGVPDLSGKPPTSVTGEQLWQAYGRHARQLGNHHQLLAGDDGGWLAQAGGTTGAGEQTGRGAARAAAL